mmetsp:Transcript_13906/g.13883  ORF Transcript_13906/g.13883 Transcript_13906/m.13883 type:complete len:97 (+) Transcript_13906:97-387(+)
MIGKLILKGNQLLEVALPQAAPLIEGTEGGSISTQRDREDAQVTVETGDTAEKDPMREEIEGEAGNMNLIVKVTGIDTLIVYIKAGEKKILLNLRK